MRQELARHDTRADRQHREVTRHAAGMLDVASLVSVLEQHVKQLQRSHNRPDQLQLAMTPQHSSQVAARCSLLSLTLSVQPWPVTPSSRFFAASPAPCTAGTASSSGGSGGIYCIGGGDTASRAWDTFELFSPSAGGGAQVNWTVSGKQMQVCAVPLMAVE